MKVQTLKRPLEAVQRQVQTDVSRQPRNLDVQHHPMQVGREYARALNAVKLDRMFAKPLVGNLGNGHTDAVQTSAVCRSHLLPLISGSADGCVKVWDLATRTEMTMIRAHQRSVTGVVFGTESDKPCFYSCSDDGNIHQWTLHSNNNNNNTNSTNNIDTATHVPVNTWRIDGAIKSIDHHWHQAGSFATASSDALRLWDASRSSPVQLYSSNDETINMVRYHSAERHLLGYCTADRGVGLYDCRTGVAFKKVSLQMRSNDLQWNPMEPMVFAVANEDYNSYTFDMRYLNKPTKIYKGHVGAVMSLSWSPTGREFVTGSYDRTLRIFPVQNGNGSSRDVYYNRRMQRVWTVQYTLDNKYIVCGSDDTNLRLWKARASEKIGTINKREEASIQYRQSLVEKYQHLPEIKKIHKSRKIPKLIKAQTQLAHVQKEAADRKQANRVKHSRKDQVKFESEKNKVVVREED